MRQVGAYEAKVHLAELLDQVARGETIIITKQGKPVAKMVPIEQDPWTSIFEDPLIENHLVPWSGFFALPGKSHDLAKAAAHGCTTWPGERKTSSTKAPSKCSTGEKARARTAS